MRIEQKLKAGALLYALYALLPACDGFGKDSADQPPMRVVWCRQAGGGAKDVGAQGTELKLMGLDTAGGRGERAIVRRTGNFHKPLMTPKGDRVVFTELPEMRIFVTGWNGNGAMQQIETGCAVDVWQDPKTGAEWVYAIDAESLKKDDAGRPVFRFLLDDPFTKEIVWDKTPVNESNFQVSRDGKKACGTFPWPDAGVADLETKELKILGKGCWPSLSHEMNDLMWIFDGAHRNVIMATADGKAKWKVSINGAKGMGDWEVYHPRWSNVARYFVVSGPYKGGEGENRINEGGEDVEIFIGKFDEKLTGVEAWTRITKDRFLDVYPDLWVAPGSATDRAGVAVPPAATARDKAHLIALRAKLVRLTPTPTLQAIAPYRQALAVHEYEVENVKSGEFAGHRILVASWAIVSGKTVSQNRKAGESYDLLVGRYDDYPELEGERLVISVENPNQVLYYEVKQ